MLEHARDVDMRLALEPLHPMYANDRSCLNTLAQALDMADAVNQRQKGRPCLESPWMCIMSGGIRTFGQTLSAPAKLGASLAFHVCDWLVPTRDLLTDRGMMGDGVIDIPLIRGAVEAAGYADQVEVEIFSELGLVDPAAGRNTVGLCGASPERSVRLALGKGAPGQAQAAYSPRKSGLRFSTEARYPFGLVCRRCDETASQSVN